MFCFRLVVEPTHLKNMSQIGTSPCTPDVFGESVFFCCWGKPRGFARVNHLKRPQKIEKKSQTINKGHLLRYLTIFRGPDCSHVTFGAYGGPQVPMVKLQQVPKILRYDRNLRVKLPFIAPNPVRNTRNLNISQQKVSFSNRICPMVNC